MPLEAIQEQAIDHLVAGKRQVDVAAILNINVRTLRRWGENETFINELNREHRLASQLRQDEFAEVARENREVRKLKKKRVTEILQDPNANPLLVIQCLKLIQHDEQHQRRLEQAQEWRAFVYHDQKRERLEREAAQQKARMEFMAQTKTMLPSADLLAQLQITKDAHAKRLSEMDAIKARENAAKEARNAKENKADSDQSSKPDKSGQTPGDQAAVPVPATHKEPDRSGHLPTPSPSVAHFIKNVLQPSPVQPVKPFRYDTQKKADKTGH